MSNANLPIGIFDSGVGGLTVLNAIHKTLPHENLIYLGDTARLPYGTKSPETVTSYARQAAGKLVERGIKMLVIACNTATAAALPALRDAFAPLPVLGVINPGAAAAIATTKNGHIAVIATEGTIKGQAYQKAIAEIAPQMHVTGQACTLFVHLAEEGWTDGPLVEGIAARYLNHIFNSKELRPDTLLLGCTHFPPLRESLTAVVGEDVNLVDSAATTARAVHEELAAQNLLHLGKGEFGGNCHFMTTDDAKRFARIGGIFLGQTLEEHLVEHIDL